MRFPSLEISTDLLPPDATDFPPDPPDAALPFDPAVNLRSNADEALTPPTSLTLNGVLLGTYELLV